MGNSLFAPEPYLRYLFVFRVYPIDSVMVSHSLIDFGCILNVVREIVSDFGLIQAFICYISLLADSLAERRGLFGTL